MAGRGRYQAPERVVFVPWKPDRCEEPGCTARHPAYSRNGMAGPWRCRTHDQLVAHNGPTPGSAAPEKSAALPNDRLL